MRWILRLGGALVVVVLLAVGVFLLIPAERIAALATDRLSAATGRSVTISGAVRPTLWPDLGVVAEGIEISNPGWVEAGPMLRAERLNVSVTWASIFAGAIQLQQAELSAPEITLVRAADGRTSWTFETAELVADAPATETESGGGPGTAASIGFDRAEITGGRLRYIDLSGGAEWDLSTVDAVLTLPEAGGRATLDGSAVVNGTALELSAAIDGIAPLLEGAVRPVTGAMTWSGGTAEFDGRLSLVPVMDGALSLTATDLGPLMSLGGTSLPDLPPGFGRDRIEVSGDVTLAEGGSLHIRDGTAVLDDNRLGVALDLLPGEDRPMLRGTITAATLSLSGLTDGSNGGGGGGASPSAGGSGWSREVIDVSGLFAADAELTLAAERVEMGTALFEPVELRATLTRGRLVFDIARIGTHGGRLAGQFVVNGRGGLSVGGDLILASVELQPLLQGFADFDRLTGTGSASLQFLGVGNDMATIMDGLEGSGDFSLGAGAILGLDLAGMIRNLDASYRGEGTRTVYDSVTANFTIADGVLSNDDLRLDAPWGEVQGEGTVDLGAQTLSYRATPGLMRDDAGVAGIRVPVLISGPWANLSYRPDLAYLAEQELAEQRELLEAEARARLAEEQDRIEAGARSRANELLGTEIEEGASREEIEAELERRLQEEGAAQILRLLGGN